MGTNYYHRTNICKHCNRYDEEHIGKSSSGWTFSFHGDREGWELKHPITSFEDWKKILKEGKIFDENDEEISLEDFIKLVESKQNEKFNHTKYCLNQHLERKYAEKNCWLDKNGNSFSEGEFS